MNGTGRYFRTGLNFLDMRIGGGLPVGSVITFLAPPVSQSQLFLRALTTEQPLVYLSTSIRDTASFEAWLAEARRPGATTAAIHAPAEQLLTDLPAYLEAAPPESFLVVDAVNPLEAAPRLEYRGFLNDLHEWTAAADSVAVLHCFDAQPVGPLRTMTLNRVDQVWWLQLELLSREIRTRLYVTKARTGRALTEPIPLTLTDQVLIDTSRNI